MPGHTGHHPGVDAGQIRLHFPRFGRLQGEMGPFWGRSRRSGTSRKASVGKCAFPYGKTTIPGPTGYIE